MLGGCEDPFRVGEIGISNCSVRLVISVPKSPIGTFCLGETMLGAEPALGHREQRQRNLILEITELPDRVTKAPKH